jgi:hypothetical protein
VTPGRYRSRSTSPTARSTCTRSDSGTDRSPTSRRPGRRRAGPKRHGARALLRDGALPVVYAPTVRDLEQAVAEHDIRVVLYVNQNTRNFQMFRYGRRWHVFINHGESDKMYMTTNQFKAYDYALIAGDAARERLRRVLWDYDLDARTIEIGRPQADYYSGALPSSPMSAPSSSTPRRGRVTVRPPTTDPCGPTARRSPPPSSRRPRTASSTVRTRVRVSSIRVRGRQSAHHRCHHRRQRRRRFGEPRLRRRPRSRVAARRGRPRGRRHLSDGLRPSGGGPPSARDAPVDPEALVDTHGYLSDAEWLSAAASERFLEEANRVLSDPDASRARGVGAALFRRHRSRRGDRTLRGRHRRSWSVGTSGTPRHPTTGPMSRMTRSRRTEDQPASGSASTAISMLATLAGRRHRTSSREAAEDFSRARSSHGSAGSPAHSTAPPVDSGRFPCDYSASSARGTVRFRGARVTAPATRVVTEPIDVPARRTTPNAVASMVAAPGSGSSSAGTAVEEGRRRVENRPRPGVPADGFRCRRQPRRYRTAAPCRGSTRCRAAN